MIASSTTSAEKSMLLRKLGNNEAYQLAMYILDQYRGTSVSCRYVIPPHLAKLEFRADLVHTVEAAIAETFLKHSVLHVGIKDADSKKPRWIQLQSLDLHRHVSWRFLDTSANFDDASQEVTTSEVDGTFPELESCPGWRIVAMCQEAKSLLEIHFTWNHSNADGTSGKIFQEDLFRILNTQTRQEGKGQDSTGSASFVIELPQPTQLTPAIEEVCKLPVSLGFVAKTAWQEWGPQSLTWTRPTLARWAPYQLTPYKTQFRAFTIENDMLNNILFTCRQHNTTLTGVLHGLALISLALHLDEKMAPAFEGGTTIDLRRFVPSNPPNYPGLEPRRTMGNFVTLMSHEFDSALVAKVRSTLVSADQCPPLSNQLVQQLWSISGNVRRQIEQKLDMGLKNDIVGSMKFVGDWRQEMINAAKRPRQFSWWVTGVGVLDTPSLTPEREDTGTWAIRQARFTLSTETTASAIMISPMTAGGRLSVGVSWQDCICDVSMGESIMADLERWLGQLASQR